MKKSRNLKRTTNHRTRKNRKFVFELTPFQFFFLLCLICLALFWMFGLGLTIGRGIPLENQKSLWAKMAYMLGFKNPKSVINKETSYQSEKPAKTRLSLTYYDALTKPPKKRKKEQEQVKEQEEPPPSSSEKELAGTEELGFTILVASFKNKKNAEQLEKILKSKGYQVARQIVSIRGNTWHRVMVGNFKNRDDAMKFVALFNKKEKMEAIVIHK